MKPLPWSVPADNLEISIRFRWNSSPYWKSRSPEPVQQRDYILGVFCDGEATEVAFWLLHEARENIN